MLSVVSIHTPTKGVTGIRLSHILSPECFNPHTHEGCDKILRTFASDKTSFNPHTHEGCDPKPSITRAYGFCFNPHTHEGCDKWRWQRIDRISVSIHTPTKGVTPQQKSILLGL